MTTTKTDLTIANTILAQLGGAGRLGAMIGAAGFVGSANALSFRFKAKSKAGNAIRVVLEADDTYSVEFLAIRGTTVKVTAKVAGVYADALKRTIEGQTGLALAL